MLVGLQNTSGSTTPTAWSERFQAGWLTRHPLYRKELLWFWRDRGAVIQAILIPLTIGALQVFNLRGLAELE